MENTPLDNSLLDFTDLYIIQGDIEKSYCYYKKDHSKPTNPPRRVDKELIPHIENMLKAYEEKKNKLLKKDSATAQSLINTLIKDIDAQQILQEELLKNTSLEQSKIDHLLAKVDIQKPIREKLLKNAEQLNTGVEHKKLKDISFTYLDRHFRTYTIEGQHNNQLVCRQNFSKDLNLEKLGLHPLIYKELIDKDLSQGGLVLLCGTNGSGKSTTSAALIKERLGLYGGFCMTVEDPVEIAIEGNYGEGICIQVQVEPHEGFAPKIRELMRAYPTGQNLVLLIGEIRDGDTAAQVLKAALDGRLVITTIHADNVESALKRLIIMASETLTFEGATDVLSDSLRLCLHQSLLSGRLATKFLKSNQTVSSIIKSGDITKLNSEIERQDISISKNIALN